MIGWSFPGISPMNYPSGLIIGSPVISDKIIANITVFPWYVEQQIFSTFQDSKVVETWIASNNTLIRHVVTGPEDPKAELKQIWWFHRTKMVIWCDLKH